MCQTQSERGIPELPWLPGGSSPALASHLPSPLPPPPRSVLGWGLRGRVLPRWGQRTPHSRTLHFKSCEVQEVDAWGSYLSSPKEGDSPVQDLQWTSSTTKETPGHQVP